MPPKRASEALAETTRNVRRKVEDIPDFGSNLVKVVVGRGANKKKFTLPSQLLMRHSEFFRAALSGDWKEAKTRKIIRPEDDPEAFNVFVAFLHTGVVFSEKEGDYVPSPDEHSLGGDGEWPRLKDAWELGQALLSTTFKNAVVDATRTKIVQDQRYPADMIEALHPLMSKQSGMRSLLMDVAVWNWSEPAFELAKGFTNAADIFSDIAVALMHKDKIAKPPVENDEPCAYHEHVAGRTPCWRTMF